MITRVKNKVYHLLSKELISKGLMISELTDKSEIKSLIESLHPYVTDKPLIRMGPDGDGGYLLPDDLQGIEACFSPRAANISR